MDAMLRDELLLVSLAVAGAVGLSVALVTWLLVRALAAVPGEDRAYKDPPPLGFRLAWWPIQWVSHYVGPLMPARTRAALRARLRRAGLDFSFTAEQFFAARLVAALSAAVAGHWLLGSFERDSAPGAGFSSAAYVQAVVLGGLVGWMMPAVWLRDRIAARRRELLKALPFYLDLITLCVEAGLNLQGAMAQAVAKSQGPLRDEFQRVLRDIRAGKPRSEALRDLSERLAEPSVTTFTSAVIQADRMGMSLGPVLRAQAEQRRTERFMRAEKLAMEAPVKMLLPLIAFIFPCTFIVLFFPIAMKLMNSGL